MYTHRLLISAALAIAASCCFTVGANSAEIVRSATQRAHFVKANACPKTNKNKLPCPGYVVDHIVPLCAGGKDAPENMQWQTKEDGLAKDKLEWAQCRDIKKKLQSG